MTSRDRPVTASLPCVTLNRGEAGTVVRLLVVPVYEGESNDDALREALAEHDVPPQGYRRTLPLHRTEANYGVTSDLQPPSEEGHPDA